MNAKIYTTAAAGLLLAGVVTGCSAASDQAPSPNFTGSTSPTAPERRGTVTQGGSSSAAKGPCSSDTFATANLPVDQVWVDYCDGHLAHYGRAQTDHGAVVQWDGGDWVPLEADGKTYTGFPCYDQAKLDALNVPPELEDVLYPCE